VMAILSDHQPSYMYKIFKKKFITYSHLSNIINTLEKKGLLTTTKDGALRLITLTPSGKKLADACKYIIGNKIDAVQYIFL